MTNNQQTEKEEGRLCYHRITNKLFFSFAGRESHLQTGYNYVPESNVWWKIR